MAKKKEKYSKVSTGQLVGFKQNAGDNPTVSMTDSQETNAESKHISMMLKSHDNLCFHFKEEIPVPLNDFYSTRAPAIGNSCRANQDLGSCAFDEENLKPYSTYEEH